MIYRAHFDALHRVLQDAISPPDLLTPVAFENKALQLSFHSNFPVQAASFLREPMLHCWDCVIPVFPDPSEGINSLDPSEQQGDSSMSFLRDTIKY